MSEPVASSELRAKLTQALRDGIAERQPCPHDGYGDYCASCDAQAGIAAIWPLIKASASQGSRSKRYRIACGLFAVGFVIFCVGVAVNGVRWTVVGGLAVGGFSVTALSAAVGIWRSR